MTIEILMLKTRDGKHKARIRFTSPEGKRKTFYTSAQTARFSVFAEIEGKLQLENIR